MICKNCDNNFEGNFCNNCGQKANTKRVNFKYLIDEISNNFFQINRGIFFTIKELSIEPGKTIREYFSGKRKLLYKPLSYFLLLSTIYLLFTSAINKTTLLEGALSGMFKGMSDNKETLDANFKNSVNIVKWFSNHLKYTSIILLPLFSFSSYVIFRKPKYNYIEHLILNLYIAGHQTIIFIVYFIITYVLKNENESLLFIPIILSTIYLFWVYIKFFNTKRIYSTVLLITLVNIFYYLLIIITVGIILITPLFFN